MRPCASAVTAAAFVFLRPLKHRAHALRIVRAPILVDVS